MPVYLMLLAAITPILLMVATSGDALGQDAHAVALIALIVTVLTLALWLVKTGIRTVVEIWRRKLSRPFL